MCVCVCGGGGGGGRKKDEVSYSSSLLRHVMLPHAVSNLIGWRLQTHDGCLDTVWEVDHG